MKIDVGSRVEYPFAITPEGVTVTSHDGITVKITGSPGPISDAMLRDMFKAAMNRIRYVRKSQKNDGK